MKNLENTVIKHARLRVKDFNEEQVMVELVELFKTHIRV